MRAARLAAAGAVAGAVVLGTAGPAFADPTISASPNPFTPGQKLTVKVTECLEAPTGDATAIFTANPAFTGAAGKTWTAVAATRADLKPGTTYTVVFSCKLEGGTAKFSLKVNPGKPKPTPTPTPTTPEPPKFSFGYDDVKLTTRKVVPGGKIGFTVNCPTAVTITGNGFTTKALAVKQTGKGTFKAVGAFRAGTLPNPTTATVACKGHGYVKYSTKPGQAIKPKPGGNPEIPVGAPNTGDGTLYGHADGGSSTALLAGGSAAGLAVVGGGLLLLRRRSAGREQA
ncbi:hypothetical protein [Actinomadura flavalba]|uniref:hypothetical protein n=1 Tax=Actinomadura flavalba TaxID=1120938 RepID=UPI0006858F74|nr:hypothetical protein [Actinomadura flavalba]